MPPDRQYDLMPGTHVAVHDAVVSAKFFNIELPILVLRVPNSL